MRILAIILLGLTISLGGCSQSLVYQEVQKQPLALPEYPALDFKPVEFRVLEEENKTFFALDTENYSNLSKNMTEIQGYIKYLKESLKKYQEYYEGRRENERGSN